MRTGLGFDIHRLIPTVEKSTIAIGGIDLPCFYRVEAHSDGDVLLHAVVDALLGAACLGDIGQWFPDNSPINRNRKSHEFVTEALTAVQKLGFKVSHLDSNVFLEEPKLAPHSLAIRTRLAELLQVELTQVNLKAKTMEGLGPIGERKAVSAQVVLTLTN